MNKIVIASIVGVFQIFLSINLIVRQKNKSAIISEGISSLMLLYYLNGISIEVNSDTWRWICLTLVEYTCVKLFLVIFMLIARYGSFYIIKSACQSKKKIKSSKLRFVKRFSKVKYWPRLILGLPGMANKRHPKTKVCFDDKGFPKFKVYYTVKLKKKYFCETRERHFYMANKILDEDIFCNRKLRSKFSKSQIKQISQYETPSGYTWHHHQDAGVLQLVDAELHSKTHHVGGYTIWDSKK